MEDNNNIKKIWGTRQRLISNDQTEVDLLYLDKDSACSIHNHDKKINRFILLKGSVAIKSDLGTYLLQPNIPFDVEPPHFHQFVVLEDSTMIEIAYVKDGVIGADDINRRLQGGKFINGRFVTLEDLKLDEWKDYD